MSRNPFRLWWVRLALGFGCRPLGFSNVAGGHQHRKKPLIQKLRLCIYVIDGSKLIENPGSRLAFERSQWMSL
jgi:hypothetical protein